MKPAIPAPKIRDADSKEEIEKWLDWWMNNPFVQNRLAIALEKLDRETDAAIKDALEKYD